MGEAFIMGDIGIPQWTNNDEGKILSVINNKLTWIPLEMFNSNTSNLEYRWIITPSTTTIYNQFNMILNETETGTEWICPSDGTYIIQLHASGGTGGNSETYTSSELISGVLYSNVVSASGGGGGGSGAKIELDLTEGTTYPISVSTDVTTFDTYYCNRGENGTDGKTDLDNLTATAGKGGSVGTYSDGMTCIANIGEDGEVEIQDKGIITYAIGALGGNGSAFADKNDYKGYGNGSKSPTAIRDGILKADTPFNCAIIIRKKIE